MKSIEFGDTALILVLTIFINLHDAYDALIQYFMRGCKWKK